VLTHYFSGRRPEAAAMYARILPLINFENRQCGLRASKTVMKEGGVIKSDAVRHPSSRCIPARAPACSRLAAEAESAGAPPGRQVSGSLNLGGS
jgi:dihydrodipicolinate synthase/N-acetylneuraminate lyase